MMCYIQRVDTESVQLVPVANDNDVSQSVRLYMYICRNHIS